MKPLRATVTAAVLGAAFVFLSSACRRPAPDEPAATTRPAPPATAPVVEAPSGPPEWAAKETSLSDVVQLTAGFERAGEAYFSADGNWVIFQAAARGEAHYQMYVAKLRRDGDRITGTETPVRISPPNSRNTCGYFSPDGRSLIFASTAGKEDPNEPAAGYQRQGGNYRWDFPNGMEIYRADDWQAAVEEAMKQLGQVEDRLVGAAPGSGSRTNLHDSYAFVDLAKKAITANVAYDAEGAFSPDGKWIVFGSRRDGDSELYVMRPDGSSAVRLTHTPGYDGGPFFSPDGKRIVYRSDRKGNDLLQVFTAELKFAADGAITGIRNERKLTDDANVNWGPFWHPDGRHVIYATSAHGHTNYELYWMNDDGTGKTRITYAPGFDGLPAFSADGKYLMWSSKRSKDNTTQVFVARFKAPG